MMPEVADYGRDLTGDLRSLIESSQKIVAFTGAGISAESGIPTYREADALWTKYDPEKYASIDYFRRDPGYFWSFFRDVRLTTIKKARPNPAHLALAKLETTGKLISVITQNIDGLHQRAGSSKVIELHGNTTRFYCSDCGKAYNFSDIEERLSSQNIPKCSSCTGGVLRPDVVLFGELLPEGAFESALDDVTNCDLMLVIGSSLVVYPAAEIPCRAKLKSAKLAIVNLEETPFDHLADLVVHNLASEVLSKMVN